MDQILNHSKFSRLNPDTAVEFWEGCTRESYLSLSEPYALAPMMGETCLRAKALWRRRGGGVRGRQENGQRASMVTALNTHQSKLQLAFSFAYF